MPDVGCADDLGDLEAAVSQSFAVSPASLKLLHRNGCRYIFKARFPSRDCCALKCFLHSGDAEKRSAVEEEAEVAEWAAQQQLGVPVHGVVRTPQVTILVMAMALADFEVVLQSCHQFPYVLIRGLFDQAFRLVTHEKLVARGLICSDLKPANFLVYTTPRTGSALDLAATVKGDLHKGRRIELRLTDFDPFFCSESTDSDVALLNGFFLLANCVGWKTAVRLGPYLPTEAIKLAEAVRTRAQSLMRALSKHQRLLRRGPIHYSRLPHDKKTSLHAFLEALAEALTRHGL